MGWERRRNGMYYYEKQRKGKRVVSRYIPGKVHAQKEAELQRLTEERRQYEKKEEQQRRKELAAIEKEAGTVEDSINRLLTALLAANGYHTRKGEWRKRR